MLSVSDHAKRLTSQVYPYLGGPRSPPDCFVVFRVSRGGGRDPIGGTADVFCGIVDGGTSYVGSCIDGGAWLKVGGGGGGSCA